MSASVNRAYLYNIQSNIPPTIEHKIMLNNTFSLLQYTRSTAHMARRKCSNWKRKTTNSSFYLLTTMTMPMPLPQQPTTIARFCSHFTNYVGRWEHYFNKNCSGTVFLWLCDQIKLLSDRASARERERHTPTGPWIRKRQREKGKEFNERMSVVFFYSQKTSNQFYVVQLFLLCDRVRTHFLPDTDYIERAWQSHYT